jgi:predicted RNA methylase
LEPGAPEPDAVLFGLEQPSVEVVRAMLELADIQSDDRVYVLGCGDGGIAMGAALLRGARVVVVDSSPATLTAARDRARRAGVESLIEFRQGNVLEVDIKEAQVVLTFLGSSVTHRLGARLQTHLKPGTRCVSWLPAPRPVGMQGGDEGDVEGGTLSLYKVPGHSHPDSLAPYVRTPLPVVRKMLDLADVTKDDVLYDLGCGDGRIVIEAARRHGTRGVGIDFDIRRIREARERARREGVEGLVAFRWEDIRDSDFSDATVVMLFLLPDANNRLRARLAALPEGTRVVSHRFDIEGWRPSATETLELPDGRSDTIYLWVVGEGTPAEVPGPVRES